jgi:hypothetical protein
MREISEASDKIHQWYHILLLLIFSILALESLNSRNTYVDNSPVIERLNSVTPIRGA